MKDLSYAVRVATVADLPAVQAALAYAIDWRTPRVAKAPEARIEETGHAYILADWGRSGDTAVVAESGNRAVGAAWYRFWTDDLHSYGYVDSSIPELGIGVAPEFRGRGIGTSLMTFLIEQGQKQGIQGLSLSVESDNPATGLYQKFGFERYARLSNAWTMVKRFDT